MRSDVRPAESFSGGSYAEMAPQYLPIAGRIVDRAGVDADDRVLDVGCGTGNVAITAARRGADVTGLDLEPSMLEVARENAEIAGLEGLRWLEGDAADLPFEADAFDVTLSALGHMLAEPSAAAARELVRVTRPGGRVAFAAWTPGSLYPELGAVLLPSLPPAARPDYDEPPFLWGDPGIVRERLGDRGSALAVETETVGYPAQSPAHFWRELSTHWDVFREAMAAIDEAERDDVVERCIETIEPYFDGWENVVVLEYLATAATVE